MRFSKSPERHRKHIRTVEDWYPTLEPYQQAVNTDPQFNNTLDDPAVCASVVQLSDGSWRVSVWGGDDFGLVRDVKDRIEAFKLYAKIVDYTSQADLKAAGFKPF